MLRSRKIIDPMELFYEPLSWTIFCYINQALYGGIWAIVANMVSLEGSFVLFKTYDEGLNTAVVYACYGCLYISIVLIQSGVGMILRTQSFFAMHYYRCKDKKLGFLNTLRCYYIMWNTTAFPQEPKEPLEKVVPQMFFFGPL